MEKLLTESSSGYRHLEKMSVPDLLQNINREDKTIAFEVEKALGQIARVVEVVAPMLQNGGRLFYIGAGSSGRLGILDASECPPTFGVEESLFSAIIAGGDMAIRKAVEKAEDDENSGFEDLRKLQISVRDFVIGIAASGKTPYVLGALKECKVNGISTGCIVCNPNTPIANVADYPVEVLTGPEFLSGSTRMKAGTAQKMVLNMISTAIMIKLGKVKDNKMVDMKISNEKLKRRAVQIICHETGISEATAEALLVQYGSVRAALSAHSSRED